MPSTEALTTYLRKEISTSDLRELLDEHLHTMIQLCAIAGEPITEEQACAYHHIRRLRDLIGDMEVEHTEADAS